MGSMACLVALISFAPPPTLASGYVSTCAAMAAIAKWVFFPSLVLTLIAGLLAIAASPIFHNAGWAWAKAATGIVVFEAGLVNIQGPIQAEADRSAGAPLDQLDPIGIAHFYSVERITLWLMLAVALANVVLGIWRPRFSGRRDSMIGATPPDA